MNSHISDHKQAILSFDNNKQDNFLCIQNTQFYTTINKANYEKDLNATFSRHLHTSSFNDLIGQLENCKNANLVQKNTVLEVTQKNHGLVIVYLA